MHSPADAPKAAESSTRALDASATRLSCGVKRRHHSHADLCSETWVAYVATLTRVDVGNGGAVSVGGHRLTDSETRQLGRWRAGSCPSLFTADRWMVAASVHLNAYFAWAQSKNLPAWAVTEPWFERQELSELDWEQIAKCWPVDGEDNTPQLCEALAA